MLLQHVGHVKGDVAMDEIGTRVSEVISFQESQQGEDLRNDHGVRDVSARGENEREMRRVKKDQGHQDALTHKETQ
jgi:hypothetical protein